MIKYFLFLLILTSCNKNNDKEINEKLIIMKKKEIAGEINIANGKNIFNGACATCHLYGTGGSIQLKDKIKWDKIIQKKPEPKKQVEKTNTKPKRSLTRSINRSNTRPINRSNNRKTTHSKNNRSKTNRKISIRNKKFGEKDIQNVSQKMRQIRSTKTDEIKKELEKQGVKVSGKSDRLLKDIYLYSKVCNINITHEK